MLDILKFCEDKESFNYFFKFQVLQLQA